jgi:hypothetical protein
MKKAIVIVFVLFLSLNTGYIYGSNSILKVTPISAVIANNKENKLSSEEISCLKNRVEEIRKMDKSTLTSAEKRELRNELKGIKESVRRSDSVIYISGGTLILIIIILIILL